MSLPSTIGKGGGWLLYKNTPLPLGGFLGLEESFIFLFRICFEEAPPGGVSNHAITQLFFSFSRNHATFFSFSRNHASRMDVISRIHAEKNGFSRFHATKKGVSRNHATLWWGLFELRFPVSMATQQG